MKGIAVGVLGHIHPELSDEQLERLGNIDVLLVPVGNAGYTMDAKSAAKIVKAIDPKIVVPTHYAEAGIKFEVDQSPVEEFFKEMGVEPEKVESLKLKFGQLPVDITEYYQLKRSS
jgi:L-ascorbate metabolism protein UlaG (beta-lactamase superfamily)